MEMILKKLWERGIFSLWYERMTSWFTFAIMLTPCCFAVTLFGHGLSFNFYTGKNNGTTN